MSRLKIPLDEERRRALVQVLGAYGVSAWLIWQVVGSIYEWIGLPDWVPPTALVLLLIGLPVVLATAFFQGRPGSRADEPAPLRSAGTTRPFLTWHRAVTAGVLAFAALGLAAAGFMGMRSLGIGPAATLMSTGRLESREPLILADFENRTGEAHLGQTVTEALRVELSQSTAVRVLDPSELAEPLARMGRNPVALDASLARQLAVREGYGAVIAGEVSPAGSGILLTARVEDAAGVALVRFRETAAAPTDVIDAIDRLSRSIRERVGESLRSINRSPPLAQVTTGSLDALELYTRGMRALDQEGNHLEAAALFERAVAIDTAFAMAYRKLSNTIGQTGGSASQQNQALEAAWRHRDRLGPRERGVLEGYWHNTRGDADEARMAYEQVLEDYPEDGSALNNLAVILAGLRRLDDAAELYRRSAEAMPGYIPYRNLVQTLFDAGRTGEARSALDEMRAALPGNLFIDVVEMYIRSAAGDLAGADSIVGAMAVAYPDNSAAPMRAAAYTQVLSNLQGRVRDGEAAVRELSRRTDTVGRNIYRWTLLRQVETTLRVLGDRELALSRLENARSVALTDTIGPLERDYRYVALLYAMAGETGPARDVMAAYRSAVPDSLRLDLDEVEARIAEADGDPDSAFRFYSVYADTSGCPICAFDDLGRLHETLGRPDSAVTAYTRYLETPYHHRQDSDDMVARANVLERLADLHEQAGRPDDAARYYAELVELWADADPVLQPRVEYARQALVRIGREPGQTR